MRRLILNAIAFAENAGVPTQVKDVSDVADVYLKNAFVSLVSAQEKNPDVNVCIVVNAPLQPQHTKMFREQNIPVYITAFDANAIPNTFHWQLAFFKLFALAYIVNNTDFDQYLLIDSDVYSAATINDFWKELEPDSISLYHLPSTYTERTRKEIIDGYEIIYGRAASVPNYGGELIAGYRGALIEFSKHSMNVYKDMLEQLENLSDNIGDEFVTSIAAYTWQKKIVLANGYITRFLTGRVYSSVTHYHSIPLWHMPIEKGYTFLKIFRFYQKKRGFPSNRQVAAWAGLPVNKRTHALPYFTYRIWQKAVKKVKQKLHKP